MHSCCLKYWLQEFLLGIDSNDNTEVAPSFCGGLNLFLWVLWKDWPITGSTCVQLVFHSDQP